MKSVVHMSKEKLDEIYYKLVYIFNVFYKEKRNGSIYPLREMSKSVFELYIAENEAENTFLKIKFVLFCDPEKDKYLFPRIYPEETYFIARFRYKYKLDKYDYKLMRKTKKYYLSYKEYLNILEEYGRIH